MKKRTPGAEGAFPTPDRSDQTPHFSKSAENGDVDIGWNEGVLRDGRPYRVEAWAADGVTSLTYFFSTRGLEAYSDKQFAELLEREGLLRFTGDTRHVGARTFVDAAGSRLWSVNVVMADEDESSAEDHVPLRSYRAALLSAPPL